MKPSQVELELIKELHTDDELHNIACPKPPEITVKEEREIAELMQAVEPKKNRTRYDKLEPHARASNMLTIWFNSNDGGDKLGYKKKTNFARNIPTTAIASMGSLDDDEFDEMNRVLVLLKKRSMNDYRIIKEYFTKVQGSHIGEKAVARNLKQYGITLYMVRNELLNIVGWVDRQIDWGKV